MKQVQSFGLTAQRHSIQKIYMDHLIPPGTPYLLPWSTLGTSQKRMCDVNNSEEPSFEVYRENDSDHWYVLIDDLDIDYKLPKAE